MVAQDGHQRGRDRIHLGGSLHRGDGTDPTPQLPPANVKEAALLVEILPAEGGGVAKAQTGESERSGQRIVPRIAALHLGEEASKLLRQQGVQLLALIDDWEADAARGISIEVDVGDRVLHHGAKHTEPALDGGHTIATGELSVDPGLDIHGAELAEVNPTDGLEDVILEGPSVSCMGA